MTHTVILIDSNPIAKPFSFVEAYLPFLFFIQPSKLFVIKIKIRHRGFPAYCAVFDAVLLRIVNYYLSLIFAECFLSLSNAVTPFITPPLMNSNAIHKIRLPLLPV